MESALKLILYSIAFIALATGLNVIINGASAILGATTNVEAAIDNELRFFAMFWLMYGVFVFWVAINLQEQKAFVPFIALAFFLGGIARAVSLLQVGSPADRLVYGMAIELVLPLILYAVYTLFRRQLN